MADVGRDEEPARVSGRALRPSWPPAPVALSLGEAEAHVWCVRLDTPAATRARLLEMLDDAERRSAEEFHFARDRDRYVVTRGVLRVLLGRYLGRESSRLRFRYGLYQKPALVEEEGPNGSIRFNVAHSAGLALVAVGRGGEVGVDVERIRPDLPIEDLARRTFSPGETATLMSLSGEARVRAFFDGWTRKEAYVKARGTGLARPLETFDVSLAPGDPARLLADRVEPEATAHWSVWDLPVGAGYAAALAVGGIHWRLSVWQWQDEAPNRKGVTCPRVADRELRAL